MVVGGQGVVGFVVFESFRGIHPDIKRLPLLDGKPRAFFFHQSPQMRPAPRPEGPVVGMNEDTCVVQRLPDLMVGHVKLVERKPNEESRCRAASCASAVVCRAVVR